MESEDESSVYSEDEYDPIEGDFACAFTLLKLMLLLTNVLANSSRIFVWETTHLNANGTFTFQTKRRFEMNYAKQLALESERYVLHLHSVSTITDTSQRQRRTGPALSHQVRALIGEGNQAYVDNDLSEAIRIMHEVIRIEPRAISAWTVIAQCYEDKHEPKKALQLRIIAAHLRHDAEEWERLARQSR